MVVWGTGAVGGGGVVKLKAFALGTPTVPNKDPLGAAYERVSILVEACMYEKQRTSPDPFEGLAGGLAPPRFGSPFILKSCVFSLGRDRVL